MSAKKSVGMKAVVLLLAIVLLIGCTVGGTLAWLMTKTDPVVNTFSTANISITLTETWNTDTDNDQTNDAWTAKMVPGTDIAKDPKVTVAANSETCWLFVKVAETETNADNITTSTATADTYITYSIITGEGGWTALDATGHPGVYYREVSASTSDQSFYVLAGTGDTDFKNGYVHIPDTVTKAMMDQVTTGNEPKLTFTAYAIQREGFSTAAEAWTEASQLDSTAGT